MRTSGPPAARLLIGLGLGAIGGGYLHAAGVWSGLALVMVGVGVAIASGPRAPESPADPAGGSAGERPGLRGMGSRVEQILRLAEQQADDLRAKAEREAKQIVADAQGQARAIVEKAREQEP